MHQRIGFIFSLILFAVTAALPAQRGFAEGGKQKMSKIASPASGQMPAEWRFVGGDWQRRALIRPEVNRARQAIVTADRHVAFPSICKTRRGTLLVVYREGYSHASGNPDDGRIMIVRSEDGGKSWSKPAFAYDDPAYDDRNAAIACMHDGALALIWDKYLHGKHYWIWLSTSNDDGRTWSEAIKVSKTVDVHSRSPILDLGNGKWLIPYSESTHGPTTATYFSIYDPRTRQFEEVTATPPGQRNIADEVCVARAANGELVALIRSNIDPVLFQITSQDEGRAWSAAQKTNIPSQFTPADLIRLENGWLLCSFSFRERRNERLVVSRDNGRTWDIENSVDVFEATPGIGGDRSYPASVQLDADTIGTVLYETHNAPAGGRIYFVTTPLAALAAPKKETLCQCDPEATAFALWPEKAPAEFSFRFTGRFSGTGNAVGLLLSYQDPQNYTALEYQMGIGPDQKEPPYNYVQLARCVNGERSVSQGREAAGGYYDTGNLHRLGARREGEEWVLQLDGKEQIRVPAALGKPCGVLVRRAAVAFYP